MQLHSYPAVDEDWPLQTAVLTGLAVQDADAVAAAVAAAAAAAAAAGPFLT